MVAHILPNGSLSSIYSIIMYSISQSTFFPKSLKPQSVKHFLLEKIFQVVLVILLQPEQPRENRSSKNVQFIYSICLIVKCQKMMSVYWETFNCCFVLSTSFLNTIFFLAQGTQIFKTLNVYSFPLIFLPSVNIMFKFLISQNKGFKNEHNSCSKYSLLVNTRI